MTSGLRFDHINNCAVVQCILKKVTNTTISFIMNLEGQLVYKENQMFKDMVNESYIQEPLKKMKAQFQ